MRSLSPGPRRYSAFVSGTGGLTFLSAGPEAGSAARAGDAIVTRATMPAAIERSANGGCVMAFSSIKAVGRSKGAAPVHDGARGGFAPQRRRVGGVRRIAGDANGDPKRLGQLVVLDA